MATSTSVRNDRAGDDGNDLTNGGKDKSEDAGYRLPLEAYSLPSRCLLAKTAFPFAGSMPQNMRRRRLSHTENIARFHEQSNLTMRNASSIRQTKVR